MLIIMQPYNIRPNPLVDDADTVYFQTSKNISVLVNDTYSKGIESTTTNKIRLYDVSANNVTGGALVISNVAFYNNGVLVVTAGSGIITASSESGTNIAYNAFDGAIYANSLKWIPLTLGSNHGGDIEWLAIELPSAITFDEVRVLNNTTGQNVSAIYTSPAEITFQYNDGSNWINIIPTVNLAFTGRLQTQIVPMTTPAIITITTPPTNGNVVVNSDGVTIDYTPNAGYDGPDSFEYDVNASGKPAKVDIIVKPVTSQLLDDSVTTGYQALKNISVLVNDTLSGNISITQPVHGTTVVNGDGITIDYTPNNGYYGTDSFEYDVNVSGNPATVNIVVNDSVNPLIDDSVTAEYETLKNISVLTNDSIPIPSTPHKAYRINVVEDNDPSTDSVYVLNLKMFNVSIDFTDSVNNTYYSSSINPDRAFVDTNLLNNGWNDTSGNGGNVGLVIGTDEHLYYYSIANAAFGPHTIHAPKSWTLEYTDDVITNQTEWDGANWVVLDTQTNQTGWGSNEFRRFNILPIPVGFNIITISKTPLHGTAVVNGSSVDYTPNNGYSGPDSFEYDVNASGFPATVNIAVGAFINPLVDDTISVDYQTLKNIDVVDNDTIIGTAVLDPSNAPGHVVVGLSNLSVTNPNSNRTTVTTASPKNSTTDNVYFEITTDTQLTGSGSNVYAGVVPFANRSDNLNNAPGRNLGEAGMALNFAKETIRAGSDTTVSDVPSSTLNVNSDLAYGLHMHNDTLDFYRLTGGASVEGLIHSQALTPGEYEAAVGAYLHTTIVNFGATSFIGQIPTGATVWAPSTIITITTQATNGTAVANGLTVDYTPNNGYTGPDSFEYDVNASGNPATVTVDVAAPGVTFDPLNTGLPLTPGLGNLQADGFGVGSWRTAYVTTSHTTGKWYFEITNDGTGWIGPGLVIMRDITTSPGGAATGGVLYASVNGVVLHSGSPVYTLSTSTLNDVIGVLYDGDNNTAAFIDKNGVTSALISMTSSEYYAAMGAQLGGKGTANFGATPFAHTLPAGYSSWDGSQ